MKTGIMFDMDGTLWDSTKEICYIWNEVLKEYGVELHGAFAKSYGKNHGCDCRKCYAGKIHRGKKRNF